MASAMHQNSVNSATVYIKLVDQSDCIIANLLAANPKVAPIKTVSIPQLHLRCGSTMPSSCSDDYRTETSEHVDTRRDGFTGHPFLDTRTFF